MPNSFFPSLFKIKGVAAKLKTSGINHETMPNTAFFEMLLFVLGNC